MLKALRSLAAASLMTLTCAGAMAAVIAQGNAANTFGVDNAFSIFNGSSLGITSAKLTLTSGNAVWDSNLPGQASVSFLVNPASSVTGVSHSFLDPEAGTLADFAGYYSLMLNFTNFDAGETLIFGADIDGNAFNTGSLAGDLMLDLVFSNGSTASASFELVRGDLIQASATPVPLPGTLTLAGAALLGLVARRRRSR